jgi:ribosomal protein S18 acetylase RimI-like enzyme
MVKIRSAEPHDESVVSMIAERVGLFDADGVREIQRRLAAHFMGDEALWLLAEEAAPAGVLYAIPEPMTQGTWNVLMLIVSPDAHGQGHGRALLREVEERLAARGARLLVVETSGVEAFERTRQFYARCGYTEAARIRDFYAAGDDKVVFLKSLVA